MLMIGLFLVGVPVVIMMAFVIPIWAFIDSYRDPDLKGLERACWRMLCLFLWGLGSSIYGVARSKSENLRRASAATLVGFGLIVLILAYIMRTPSMRPPSDYSGPISEVQGVVRKKP